MKMFSENDLEQLFASLPLYMTVQQVADLIGLSRHPVDDAIRNKRNPLKTFRLPGLKDRRIRTRDALNYFYFGAEELPPDYVMKR